MSIIMWAATALRECSGNGARSGGRKTRDAVGVDMEDAVIHPNRQVGLAEDRSCVGMFG